MSPEPRREMIVKAAIPLIAEYGAAVTTSKIARASGHRRRETPAGAQDRSMGREESMAAIRGAVAELPEPDKDALRLPADRIAALFLGLSFTRPRFEEETRLTAQQLADVFLHGALSRTEGDR